MRCRSALFSLMVVAATWLGGCSIQGPGQGPEPSDEGARIPADDGRPDDAVAEPIVGGSEASDYPLAVLVNMKRNGWHASSCSGSVIAPRVVLTAGHCVVAYDGWDIIAPYAGGQTASSTQAVTYDWTDNGGTVNPNQHDIGLVFLDSDIVLTHYPIIATHKLASGTKILNI
ncbi:MAG: trypsin-like serine protease, partial [Deltaproteobacteria bacterium]|nr:trypsin-like serine protease [Deltaproteobacteria bacterium]